MKRVQVFLSVVISVCLLFSVALAAEYTELYRGIKGHKEEVRNLQSLLFAAGYLGDDASEIDGVYGKKTVEAVKAFQRDQGLEATGIADALTQELLETPWDADPSLFCHMAYQADGTTEVTLCQRHRELYDAAAQQVDAAADEEQTIEALQSVISDWMEEIERLCQEWKEIRPVEMQEQITTMETLFMDYYRAGLALHNMQYESPSTVTLELARIMISNHCVELCCMLDITY